MTNELKPSFYRARIKYILEKISDSIHQGNERILRLLRNGYTDNLNEANKGIKAIAKTQSNDPLTFIELTSFSNWFVMHPDKVAGVEILTTSNAFPIKIKGKKEDIISMFNLVFDAEKGNSEAEAIAIALQIELQLMNL